MIKTINKPIDSLRPFPNNPRINDGAEKLAKVIKEYGFTSPILIDNDSEIISGHTRYLAAKILGFKEVPCILLSKLTPQEVRQFRLVDNKTAEFSTSVIDQSELESLSSGGIFDELFNIKEEGGVIIIDAQTDSQISLEDNTESKEQCVCPFCYEEFTPKQNRTQ